MSATQNQGFNSLTLKEQILVEIFKFYSLQYILKLFVFKNLGNETPLGLLN